MSALALAVQSRPDYTTPYNIPRRPPQVADTRVILPGRGPNPYSYRRRSPSPKAGDRRHRDEDVGRMPPPKAPYDDRGRSARDREARGGIGPWGQTGTGHLGTVPMSTALGGPSLPVNARNSTDPLAPLAENLRTLLLVDGAAALLLPKR